ncbi:MAG: 50S ribosomal protein L9 [Acidobacteriota bacterium]|nr:50S ribosomal protein L9 [Acidobacteriota bacterium]MDH3785961.1 50S ribosomal protein L9 [Acidobacteriota bacterium]
MKVILREHVDNLGVRGEVVSVARGYARNYLIPKQMAWEATPGNMKQVQHQRKQWAAVEVREIEVAQAMVDRLSALKLTTTRKAGESGTLYGSVTNGDIAELLAAEGVTVGRRKLIISSPIKMLGTFEIGVRLHPKLNGAVKLIVDAEGGRVADTGTTIDEPKEVDPEDDDRSDDAKTESADSSSDTEVAEA